ncbi:hypothetical protein SAMN05444390_105183 [Marinobacterium lutimaris]|uniref:Uncharacterized protein n=1 Tax=Marinobacterium lutimaris TaxID=568106 RepID=A0A1H6D7V7_9GAMM|nr:hypothetical protein SAMN05444390_105183 [Marinobacterium lutimaris]
MNRLVELSAAMLYNIGPAKGEAVTKGAVANGIGVKDPRAAHIEV